MKITNEKLLQIIKEEMDDFLNKEPRQNMHPLRQKTGHKGSATFKGLVGSDVKSIEDDPNIPEDHKRKLINLYQSGPEGKAQAIQLMSDMGYGVEPEFDVDSYDADSFKSNLPFQFPDSAYKHRGMKDVEMRKHLRLENKLKITNEQLKQIIKEELEAVLEGANYLKIPLDSIENKVFHDRKMKAYNLKGPQDYRLESGSHVETIKQDPNIPPEHKKKLIKLFQSGPAGRKQAQELMDAMGYGVEAHIQTPFGPFEKDRDPRKGDAPSEFNVDPNVMGDVYEE